MYRSVEQGLVVRKHPMDPYFRELLERRRRELNRCGRRGGAGGREGKGQLRASCAAPCLSSGGALSLRCLPSCSDASKCYLSVR